MNLARIPIIIASCVLFACQAAGQSTQNKPVLPANRPAEKSPLTPGSALPQEVSMPLSKPSITGSLRIYVAGESIEKRNRYVEAPFKADGTLNTRSGDLNNDNDEYGWLIPMQDRLRQSFGIQAEFVGSESFLDADDNPYSGTYPAGSALKSAAISGTDISAWLEQRQAELDAKTHCYDLAFAARGGNDFGNDNDQDYQMNLKQLIQKLDQGSNCKQHPRILVTAHMPDDQRENEQSATEYQALQQARFKTRTELAVNAIKQAQPELNLEFVDLFTPFVQNKPTLAFPNPVWAQNGRLNYDLIVREGDRLHIRRLASIYAGELSAAAIAKE